MAETFTLTLRWDTTGFWLTLAIIALGTWVIFALQSKLPKNHPTSIDALAKRLDLEATPRSLLLLFTLTYVLAFGSLALVLLWTIWHLLWLGMTGALTHTNAADIRPILFALAASIAALGSLIALPLTILRLRLNTRQTATTEDSLFNDKINAAAANLAARRIVTTRIAENGKDQILTEHQDDIVTRANAIARLEALAIERPTEAPQIARMLCIYLYELSKLYPAKPSPRAIWNNLHQNTENSMGLTPEQISERTGITPDDITDEAILNWAKGLRPARSDMERAAQAVFRLNSMAGNRPNLTHVNFQGFQLEFANLRGAILKDANFDGCNLAYCDFGTASLVGVSFIGANLVAADLSKAFIGPVNISGANLLDAKIQPFLLDPSIAVKDSCTQLFFPDDARPS